MNKYDMIRGLEVVGFRYLPKIAIGSPFWGPSKKSSIPRYYVLYLSLWNEDKNLNFGYILWKQFLNLHGPFSYKSVLNFVVVIN